MTRLALILLLLGGCYESHRLTLGPDDDGVFDAGTHDFGTARDFGRPGRDARPPELDAGTGCGLCVDEVIEWGPDGAIAFERRRWELSPCDRVLQRTDLSDDTEPMLCTTNLGAIDCAALDAIETLKASAPVRELRARAPVVVGTDTRPVDGQILSIRIGDDVIGVGSACGPDPSCIPVPPEVRELAAVLDRVSESLREPGICEPGPESRTFPCGEGPESVACVLGRDVCYLGRFEEPRCSAPLPGESSCDGPPPRCDCLLVSLAESCTEEPSGEVTVRWVGP